MPPEAGSGVEAVEGQELPAVLGDEVDGVDEVAQLGLPVK